MHVVGVTSARIGFNAVTREAVSLTIHDRSNICSSRMTQIGPDPVVSAIQAEAPVQPLWGQVHLAVRCCGEKSLRCFNCVWNAEADAESFSLAKTFV